jgi:hypothetical protein
MADDYLKNWQGTVDDQLAFGKNAYLEAIPDLAQSITTASDVGGIQAATALNQGKLAAGLATRRKDFDTLEDGYIAKANDFGSDDRKNAAAAKASEDVGAGFSTSRGQALRRALSLGINPNSGNFAMADRQFGAQEAVAKAGAANKARQDVEAVADGMQKTAIGFGKDLSSQSANATQSAAYAGNAAVTSAGQPLKDRLNFAGGVSNIYSNGANGYQDLWGTSNLTAAQRAGLDASASAASSQADGQENAGMWGALGAIAGSKTGGDLISKGLGWVGL